MLYFRIYIHVCRYVCMRATSVKDLPNLLYQCQTANAVHPPQGGL